MYRLISLLAVLFLFSCATSETNEIAKDKCGCPEFKHREVISNYPGPGFHAITITKYLNYDCTIDIRIYNQQSKSHLTSGDCHTLDDFRNKKQ